MQKINTLASIEGRQLVRKVYKELRYEKQYSAISSLLQCWRICINNKDINKYTNKDVNVLYNLGFFAGTGLWLEEVVNRFYFSTINSFVYFGAAILLVLVGLRRFSDLIGDSVVIAGVIFEAAMLLFMFFIMLFTPNDELTDDNDSNESNDIVNEVGEIARDFAAAVIQIEHLTNALNDIVNKNEDLNKHVASIAASTANAVMPNPKMLEIMSETNSALVNFNNSILNLNEIALTLNKEIVRQSVREELERLMIEKQSRK